MGNNQGTSGADLFYLRSPLAYVDTDVGARGCQWRGAKRLPSSPNTDLSVVDVPNADALSHSGAHTYNPDVAHGGTQTRLLPSDLARSRSPKGACRSRTRCTRTQGMLHHLSSTRIMC